MKKFISISNMSKILDLVNPKTKKPLNHVLRYWEKEFKQIKPKILNKRRYYAPDQVELLKFIKFLLKNKGLTIDGVKGILKSNINKLDDYDSDSLKAEYYKLNFKNRSIKILNKLKSLKKHGKKVSYKSKNGS